ncbi:O-antigen ligase family protein [Mycolicibacterium novocastrense]|uniref:O-antigen ligase family protein n=1 Tax=Mycolicibacterium novocastrense TaxID=59813 RepID=A0AAW5SQC5_MYCNV|nr:O-antigen ligase family protein [Mycolicibacterium novocastrense]MCV7026350.1 O-antigen ligase family protein [Mycolicibacterium novocastrense]
MPDNVAALAGRSEILVGAAMGVTVLAAAAWVVGIVPVILVVGLPCAMAAAIYLVRRPQWAVVAMAVCEVANISGVVGPWGPISFFRISLLIGLITLGLALRDPIARGRLNRWTLVFIGLVGVFLTTRFLASIGAADVGGAFGLLKNEVADLAFVVIVMVLLQMTERHWTVAAAVVLSFAVLSVLTLVNQVLFSGTMSFGGFATVTQASGELVTTLRYGGPLPDSNFWGRHLIMGLPLAGALIVRARRTGPRWAVIGWAAAMLALLAGIYLTQSRGTFIATFVALAVWTVLSGPTTRRAAVKVLPVALLFLLIPGVGNRLIALMADVYGSQPSYSIDPSVASRMAAGEVAWTMFDDRPVFGFGPGGFQLLVERYSGLVPTAVTNPPTAAAHDLYAQIASEAGVVGLLGWAVLVIGVVLSVAIRVSRLAMQSETVERSLAAAVLAAIVAWSIASIFIHLTYLRTFGILLALAGAIAAQTKDQWRDPLRECGRFITAATAAVLLAVVVVATCLTASATRTHTASQRLTLLPGPDVEWGKAYVLDVRSREVVLPSYAALMVAGSPQTTAVADTVRGIITIGVTASSRDAAVESLRIALMDAEANLKRFGADSLYVVQPVGPIVQRDKNEQSPLASAMALGAGAIVGFGAFALLYRRLQARARRPAPVAPPPLLLPTR